MNTGRASLLLSLIAVALSAIAVIDAHHPSRSGYVPGLGELMTAIQMRHAKLGIAGESGNWGLADYEIDELDEGLSDVVDLHPTHANVRKPLTALVPQFTKMPIERLRTAIKAKNPEAFLGAFDELTAGCNGCHQTASFGFNVVTRPTSPPVTNQEFAPILR